ncbi:MAG: T9SS type A sorting domain-containing protein [Bacteroidetes bacterium]|nr:T9SS type A sorting domain-containing protein [Bacteroidota bacterium]
MKSAIQFLFKIFIFIFLPINFLLSQGQVYLVLGSDTGIWDGLNVDTYHDFYRFDLYTNPLQNGYKVMDPAFRNQITDSYGNTLKLTWWIMGGNTFRYATNTNVPLNNTMVLYSMKKYHDDMIKRWGDEVTLHYHDWIWSDFNGDGTYYWNQSTKFSEFKEDFDLTMAQNLIEENVFPVSFRSGWHYMNNDWQNYIANIIPFALHDDYPNVRQDTVEPLDNIYDWSKSSSEFVPFHPSSLNYQIPGNLKCYDDRSIYMASMDTTLMTHVFSQAQNGIDQVVCLWAHLPEDNYLDNCLRINQIVHQVAAKFPNVKFRYCTAVEAMQRWLKSTDTTKPNLSFTSEQNGNLVDFIIKTDEKIYQAQPYVVVKDINENYSIIPCYSTGVNEWKTSQSFEKKILEKAGCAVTDTVGNLSTAFINFLPDDIYIDNIDSSYSELRGNWTTSSTASWGLDSRQAVVAPNDSVKVRWTPAITQSGLYNISVQVPKVTNPVDHVIFRIYSNNQIVDTLVFSSPLTSNDWIYLGTSNLLAQSQNYIDMIAYNGSQSNETASADVIKISALVTERKLSIPQSPIDFGMVSQDDSVSMNLTLRNSGIGTLAVNGISSSTNRITTTANFPLTISSMASVVVPIVFHPAAIGKVSDTLFVLSDDSLQSKFAVPFTANVQPFFRLVDNGDSLNYKEVGQWSFSTASGLNGSSRFAYLHQSPPASASFTTKLNRSGIYDFSEIVPVTVNAAKNALYVLSIDGVPIDSIYVDQNQGSGVWAAIGRTFLPANVPIELKVIDSGENTPGAVLRADAVKFSLEKEITGINDLSSNMPKVFRLNQNYPNPFNPSTQISYQLPTDNFVSLIVYDILGREVKTLVEQNQKAGFHILNFNASDLPSGIYFYRLAAGNFIDTKKMILIK